VRLCLRILERATDARGVWERTAAKRASLAVDRARPWAQIKTLACDTGAKRRLAAHIAVRRCSHQYSGQAEHCGILRDDAERVGGVAARVCCQQRGRALAMAPAQVPSRDAEHERLQLWAAPWASRETLAFGADEQRERAVVFQSQIRGRIAAVVEIYRCTCIQAPPPRHFPQAPTNDDLQLPDSRASAGQSTP
jgi:hypothetical protein